MIVVISYADTFDAEPARSGVVRVTEYKQHFALTEWSEGSRTGTKGTCLKDIMRVFREKMFYF